MRKRVAYNSVFYHVIISDLGKVWVSWRVEKGDWVSEELFKAGNYFATEEEAQEVAKEIKTAFQEYKDR